MKKSSGNASKGGSRRGSSTSSGKNAANQTARAQRGVSRRLCDPFKFDRQLLAENLPRLALGEGDNHRWDRGLRLAGADEAGRGCLAGPLVAAAVVLDYTRAPFPLLKGLTDSKSLTPAARDKMYSAILQVASRVAWVAVSPPSIDERGLHRSNIAALCRVFELLAGQYELGVVDAFDLRRPDLEVRAVVSADYKSAAVAAASVVAKVVRDRLMRTLHNDHPEYGFADHVGYATEQHRKALRRHGPSVIHRLSFQGVATAQLELWEEEEEEAGF